MSDEDVKLPPLPPWPTPFVRGFWRDGHVDPESGYPMNYYSEPQLDRFARDYARRAILADRERGAGEYRKLLAEAVDLMDRSDAEDFPRDDGVEMVTSDEWFGFLERARAALEPRL